MNKLLLIDDEADVQYSFRRIFAGDAIQITTAGSGEEGLKLHARLQPDLVIMDVRMGGISGLETLRRLRASDARQLVIMMTAFGTTQTAIEAMKLGAYDYLLKPFDVPRLKEIVAQALQAARAMKQTVAFKNAERGTRNAEIPSSEIRVPRSELIGQSEAMQKVYKLIGQLAGSDATVLITGESGTGKELVARAIYQHSGRSGQRYLEINCAALPEALLESELFGHERGSFTGATSQRIGKFEQSDGGTILLDEIGDMTLATQTRMLRVLQSGRFERVGGQETIEVDVRVIAATNKPLEAAVAAREFREDLYYRLNVVRVELPPLRDRREDIALLAHYFTARHGGKRGRAPALAAPTLRALERYHWPGNVRELENALERATVVAKGNVILPGDLPEAIQTNPEQRARSAEVRSQESEVRSQKSEDRSQKPGDRILDSGFCLLPPAPVPRLELSALGQKLFQWAREQPEIKVLPAIERELIIQALIETKGNQIQAAKLLGITRATLRKRVEKFNIKREVAIK